MKYIKEILLFSYIFVIYFYYIIEPSFFVLHGIGILFSLTMVSEVLLKKKTVKINFFLVLFFINILWFLISYFWSIDQGEAFSIIRILISTFIFTFFLYNYIDDAKKIERILTYFVTNAFFITVYGLVMFDYSKLGLRRFDSAGNPNYVSILVLIAVIISIYFVFKKKKYYYSLYWPLGLLFIFFGGSRKVIVGLFLSIFILAILNYNVKRVLKTTILSILLILIFYQLLAKVDILQPTYERMSQLVNSFTGDEVSDGSISSRNFMISKGIEYIGEKPFLGHGVGQFRFIYANETGIEMYSHNNFIELGVNNGLVGLVFFYSLFFYIFFQFIYFNLVKDYLSKTLVVILIFLFIFGYGEVQYYNYAYYMLLIITAKAFYFRKEEVPKC